MSKPGLANGSHEPLCSKPPSQHSSPECPRAGLVGAGGCEQICHPPPHGAPRIPCFLVGEFGDQSWWGSGSQACSVRPQTTRGLTFRHQGARTMMGVLVFQSPGSGNQSSKSCLAGCVRGTDLRHCGEMVFNISETEMAIRKS